MSDLQWVLKSDLQNAEVEEILPQNLSILKSVDVLPVISDNDDVCLSELLTMVLCVQRITNILLHLHLFP